MEEGDH